MAQRERYAFGSGVLGVLLSCPCLASAAVYPINPVAFVSQSYGLGVDAPNIGLGNGAGPLSPFNSGVPLLTLTSNEHPPAVLNLLLEPDLQTHSTATVLRAGWTTSADDDLGCAIDPSRRRLTPKFLLVILAFGGLVRFLTSRTYLNFLAEVLDPKSF